MIFTVLNIHVSPVPPFLIASFYFLKKLYLNRCFLLVCNAFIVGRILSGHLVKQNNSLTTGTTDLNFLEELKFISFSSIFAE